MYAEFYMAYIKIVRPICIKCTYLIWECDDELSLQRDKSLAACTPSPCSWFWLFFWGINTSSVNTAFRCSSVSDAVIETLVLKCCCRSWLHIHRNLLLPCAEYTWVKCALLLTNSLCLPAYSNGYVCEGPPSDSSRWSVLPTVYKTAVGVLGCSIVKQLARSALHAVTVVFVEIHPWNAQL